MNRATLVASLTEPPEEDGRSLAALGKAAEWLEVRADLVGDLDPDWLRQHFPGRLLYTLRSRAEGGSFEGSREKRRRRLTGQGSRFDAVDLEGERDLAPEVLAALPPERRVISWHGPAGDVAALTARLEHLSATPAMAYKLVPRAVAAGDELAPLLLLARAGRDDVVAFAGGECGFWTRLLAPRLGLPWIYGSASALPAAPGQLPVARLVADYGLPELPAARWLFGLVGRPALASLSPRLHNAAYRALGLSALYLPFDVADFGDFWLEVVEDDGWPELGLRLSGLSVTAPYKEVAFAVAGATSPLAQRLQAVNTLVRSGGVWEGESTDAEGVVAALAARGVSPAGRRAAVVGCGGAGRAAALGLAMGGASVTLVNRGAERGLAAARALSLPFVPLAELDLAPFDLVIQATSVGRDGTTPAPLPLERVRPGTVVLDLVYGERPTRWIEEARARGLLAIDGREVLLRQAVAQFRAMTGHELPLDVGTRVLGLETRA